MVNPLRLSLLFLAIALICGCTGPKGDFVALVPDPNGKTGSITIRNETGSVEIDVPYRASTIKDDKKGPSPSIYVGKEDLKKKFEDALSIQPPPPLHFLIFFSQETRLTSSYLRIVPDIITAIRKRQSRYISVIGHTDSMGTEEYNMQLSKARAQVVKKLLVNRGVETKTISTSWHGEKQLLIPTADEVWNPINRRVEVIVR